MTTAIDSNVLVALWNNDDTLNAAALAALESALERGGLVVAAPVFAELLASPLRDEAFVDAFFQETGIFVDWDLKESIWRAGGRVYRSYAVRRRKHRDAGPRRILADFLIGAHALQNGFPLLTLDDRFYWANFPRLAVVTV
jgi:predicted nucleic acid-binding protein